MVQWNVIGQRGEGSEVRRVGEAIEHRGGRGIHLIHRRQAKHEFNGPQQAGLVILRADDLAAFGVRADDVGRVAVGAHVVPSVLRVVLNGKDAGLFPKAASAERLHDLTER